MGNNTIYDSKQLTIFSKLEEDKIKAEELYNKIFKGEVGKVMPSIEFDLKKAHDLVFLFLGPYTIGEKENVANIIPRINNEKELTMIITQYDIEDITSNAQIGFIQKVIKKANIFNKNDYGNIYFVGIDAIEIENLHKKLINRDSKFSEHYRKIDILKFIKAVPGALPDKIKEEIKILAPYQEVKQ